MGTWGSSPPEDAALAEIMTRLQPRIRERFPCLERDGTGHPRIHLNCGAGTLMVDTAMEAAATAGRMLNSLPGDVAPAELATRELQAKVRKTAAEFLGGRDAGEISFHVSSTGALFNLAYALGRQFDRRTNVIVTDLDHMANISPWESVLGDAVGCPVRRCGIDDQGRLQEEALLGLGDEQTGVVALTMASNGLGTVPPLKEIISAFRKKAPRALVVVDAVHHALHGPIDVQALDCDFLVFSGYKLFGPMVGVLWGRGEYLAGLRPYRVETNKDVAPYKFEQGTLNNASLAGLLAALEYIAWVGERLAGRSPAQGLDLRGLFRLAMTAVQAYDRSLTESVLRGFRTLDGRAFRCFGIIDPALSADRDPTFAIEVRGLTAEELKKKLWTGHALQVADGNHYSAAVVRHLGRSSICRVSFCHYHTLEDVEAFIRALREIT